MHPPPFHPDQRLSDWPDCFLELRCPACCPRVIAPIQLLIRKRGDQRIRVLLATLRCKTCGQPPAPVYLYASHHRTGGQGIATDWAIELVPTPIAS